jgi:hypothetical protein
MLSAGLKRKLHGDWFEGSIIRSSIRDGITTEKIPPGAKWLSKTRTIPVTSPFDFISGYKGKVILFDAKTVDQKTFQRSLINLKQAQSLYEFEKNKIISGYVIQYQDLVSFQMASDLLLIKRGQSFKPESGLILGTRQDFSLLPLFKLSL